MINDLPPSQQLQRRQRSTKAIVSIIASSASVFFVMIAFVFGTIYLNWLNRGNPNPSNPGHILTDKEEAEYLQQIDNYNNQAGWFFKSAIVGIIASIIGITSGNYAKRDIKRSEGTLDGGSTARWGVALGTTGAIMGILEFCGMVSLFFLVIASA